MSGLEDLTLTEDDICYECRGLGSDYSLDDYGNLVNNCPDCWLRKRWDE